MLLAETVTFGGSGLDRAVHVRKDPQRLRTAWNKGTTLPLWRGKPLVNGDRLAWIGSNHPVLTSASVQVFLGIDGDTPRFAVDLSIGAPTWQTRRQRAFSTDPCRFTPTLELPQVSPICAG